MSSFLSLTSRNESQTETQWNTIKHNETSKWYAMEDTDPIIPEINTYGFKIWGLQRSVC